MILEFFVLLSSFIFINGIIGFLLSRNNLILLLLAIELMVFSVNFNFVLVSIFFDDILGQIYVLLFLTLVAAESAFIISLLIFFVMQTGVSDQRSSVKY